MPWATHHNRIDINALKCALDIWIKSTRRRASTCNTIYFYSRLKIKELWGLMKYLILSITKFISERFCDGYSNVIFTSNFIGCLQVLECTSVWWGSWALKFSKYMYNNIFPPISSCDVNCFGILAGHHSVITKSVLIRQIRTYKIFLWKKLVNL